MTDGICYRDQVDDENGRDMTFEEVDSIGRGRIWSGVDALDLGLVDQLGGVADAVMYTAASAGMDSQEIPEVRIFPTPSFPGSMVIPGFGVTEGLEQFLSDEQCLYLMQPIQID